MGLTFSRLQQHQCNFGVTHVPTSKCSSQTVCHCWKNRPVKNPAMMWLLIKAHVFFSVFFSGSHNYFIFQHLPGHCDYPGDLLSRLQVHRLRQAAPHMDPTQTVLQPDVLEYLSSSWLSLHFGSISSHHALDFLMLPPLVASCYLTKGYYIIYIQYLCEYIILLLYMIRSLYYRVIEFIGCMNSRFSVIRLAVLFFTDNKQVIASSQIKILIHACIHWY